VFGIKNQIFHLIEEYSLINDNQGTYVSQYLFDNKPIILPLHTYLLIKKF